MARLPLMLGRWAAEERSERLTRCWAILNTKTALPSMIRPLLESKTTLPRVDQPLISQAGRFISVLDTERYHILENSFAKEQ